MAAMNGEEYAKQLTANKETVIQNVEKALRTLRRNQLILSENVPGFHEHGPDFLRTYVLALNAESIELMDEFDWKPWKKPKDPDLYAAALEFADMLHFLGNIIVYLGRCGLTEREIAEAYVEKVLINVKRFDGKVDGYGVGQPARGGG